jgi:uncharacterized phiE125 gp8 family phage protein
MLTPLEPADGDAILPIADARVHLNIVEADTYHDSAIEALRDAAIDWVEGYAGKALTRRQFLWTQDSFTSVIRLPIGPVVDEDTAISYYDSDGTDTELEDWYLGRDGLTAAHSSTWPIASGMSGSVRVTFTAGYETPADIPPLLLAGVKMALTALFEDRSNPSFEGAMRCCDKYRSVL